MAKLKKSELIPKSKLGIDFSLKICWNCLFWNPETGRCPNIEDKTIIKKGNEWRYSYFPYNHRCDNQRLFGNMTSPRK